MYGLFVVQRKFDALKGHKFRLLIPFIFLWVFLEKCKLWSHPATNYGILRNTMNESTHLTLACQYFMYFRGNFAFHFPCRDSLIKHGNSGSFILWRMLKDSTHIPHTHPRTHEHTRCSSDWADVSAEFYRIDDDVFCNYVFLLLSKLIKFGANCNVHHTSAAWLLRWLLRIMYFTSMWPGVPQSDQGVQRQICGR